VKRKETMLVGGRLHVRYEIYSLVVIWMLYKSRSTVLGNRRSIYRIF